MKKIFHFFVFLCFIVLLFTACKNETPQPQDTGYSTPTIIGRIVAPNGSVSSSLYAKVGETGKVVQASSDGSFVISGLEENKRYTLYFTSYNPTNLVIARSASSTSYGLQMSNVVAFKDFGSDIGTVNLLPTVAISGKVVMSKGQALPDVSVKIPGTAFSASTDSSGNYIIKDIPQGSYEILYEKEGYRTESKSLSAYIVSNDSSLLIPDVKMYETAGSLSGTAFLFNDNDGEALNLRLTNIDDGSYYDSITTRDSGSFLFSGVKPGKYRLTLSKENYPLYSYKDTISIESSIITSLSETIYMTQNTISGTVRLEGKDSNENISIKFIDSNGNCKECVTDNTGKYFINLRPGTYSLKYSCQDYSSYEQNITLSLNEERKLPMITLYSIYGSATGNTGISDVSINCIKKDSGNVYAVTTSSTDGIYTFPKLEMGTYKFLFTKPGYENEEIDNIVIIAGKNNSIPKITMTPSAGTVFGNTGMSLVDVSMKNSNNGQTTVVTSGTDGNYLFTNVKAGTYTLTFAKKGYENYVLEDIVISAGQSMELPRISLVPLLGSVKGKTNVGEVGIVLLSGETIKYSAASDVNGEFIINSVENGSYTIRFSKNGYNTLSKEISVLSGETTIVTDIVLKALYGSVFGNVSLANVTISLLDTSGNPLGKTTRSLSDGSFSMSNIDVGAYRLEFSKEGYVSQRKDIVIEGGKSTTVSVSMSKKKGTISGHIFLEGATDYSGVDVSAISTVDSTVNFGDKTESDGSYIIYLPDGNYTIKAQKDGYIATVAQKNAIIENGNMVKMDDMTLIKESVTLSGRALLSGAYSNSGISVVLLTSEGKKVKESVTADNGSYTFDEVAPGRYYVEVSKEGYVTQRGDLIEVLPAQSQKLKEIVLSIQVASIKGSVGLEGKSDCSDVVITAVNIRNASKTYIAKTETDGSYVFVGMEEGTYDLEFSLEGFSSATLENVSVSSTNTLNLKKVDLLIARGSVCGHVRLEGRESGNLEGTVVKLNGTAFEATTDEKGYYELEAYAGYYPDGLVFVHEDFENGNYQDSVQIIDKTKRVLDTVTLNAKFVPEVIGKVAMKDNSSPEGVIVEILGTNFKTETDTNGFFSFKHVPIGSITIAFANGDKSYVSKNYNIVASASFDLGTVILEENVASIRGTAKLAYKYGLIDDFGDISVVAESVDGKVRREAKTSTDGSFIIKGIYPGLSYKVTFLKNGYQKETVEVKSIVAGQEKIISSNPITLKDIEKPIVKELRINGGEESTDNLSAKIYIIGSDTGSSVVKMKVADTSDNLESAKLQDYQDTIDWTFEESNGEQSVFVILYDKAGNASNPQKASIMIVNQRMSISGVLLEKKLHWTKENSPYYIVGNVEVKGNSNLVIDPGVEVRFDGNYSISVDSSSMISANGTYSEPILFTASDNVSSWDGITLENTYLNYDKQNGKPIYRKGNRFSNVKFEKYSNGISGTAFMENVVIISKDIALSSFTGVLNDSEVSLGSININSGSIITNTKFVYNKAATINGSTIVDSSFNSYSILSNCNVFNSTGTMTIEGASSVVNGGTFTGNKIELDGSVSNITYENTAGNVTVLGTLKSSEIKTSVLKSTGSIYDSTLDVSGRATISGKANGIKATVEILDVNGLEVHNSNFTANSTSTMTDVNQSHNTYTIGSALTMTDVNQSHNTYTIGSALTMTDVTQNDCIFTVSNALSMTKVSQKNCKYTSTGDVTIDSGDTHNVTVYATNNSIDLKNLRDGTFSNNVLEMKKLVLSDYPEGYESFFSNFLGDYTVESSSEVTISGVYWGNKNTSELINLVSGGTLTFANTKYLNAEDFSVNAYNQAGYLESLYYDVEVSGNFISTLDLGTMKIETDITGFEASATNDTILTEYRISFEKSFSDDISGWRPISSFDSFESSAKSLSGRYSIQFKDSNGRISPIYEKQTTLNFGKYEWRILDMKGSKALVISKDVLFKKKYNDEHSNVTWETCTLRNYLNNDFYNTAFSKEEKELIAMRWRGNPDNSKYGTKGGDNTEDYIFLLCIDEANSYFKADKDRSCGESWVLRSPGSSQNYAAFVRRDGSLSDSGYDVDYGDGVRPALWLDLNQ